MAKAPLDVCTPKEVLSFVVFFKDLRRARTYKNVHTAQLD